VAKVHRQTDFPMGDLFANYQVENFFDEMFAEAANRATSLHYTAQTLQGNGARRFWNVSPKSVM